MIHTQLYMSMVCVCVCVYVCVTVEEVEGGYLTILVKYKNYIPVMNKKKDLCNIPDILQEACPLQAGIHEATLTQKFPSYAPSVS